MGPDTQATGHPAFTTANRWTAPLRVLSLKYVSQRFSFGGRKGPGGFTEREWDSFFRIVGNNRTGMTRCQIHWGRSSAEGRSLSPRQPRDEKAERGGCGKEIADPCFAPRQCGPLLGLGLSADFIFRQCCSRHGLSCAEGSDGGGLPGGQGARGTMPPATCHP